MTKDERSGPLTVAEMYSGAWRNDRATILATAEALEAAERERNDLLTCNSNQIGSIGALENALAAAQQENERLREALVVVTERFRQWVVAYDGLSAVDLVSEIQQARAALASSPLLGKLKGGG